MNVSGEKGEFKEIFERNIACISTDGPQVVTPEFLNFLSNRSGKQKSLKGAKVVSLSPVIGMSKLTYLIRQGNFQYFLTDSIPTNRRLDLMNSSHIRLVEQQIEDKGHPTEDKDIQVLFGNVLVVNLKTKFLVFSNDSMMLLRIELGEISFANIDFGTEEKILICKNDGRNVLSLDQSCSSNRSSSESEDEDSLETERKREKGKFKVIFKRGKIFPETAYLQQWLNLNYNF
jgi:hypothetical protein